MSRYGVDPGRAYSRPVAVPAVRRSPTPSGPLHSVSGTAATAVSAPGSFVLVREAPLSTFELEVDTASYTIIRRYLQLGQLPPPEAVRLEEMINYFTYADPAPPAGEVLAVHSQVGVCPWNPRNRLLRVAMRARATPAAERPAANLVFLVDVSGSMQPPNKLPLLKQAMRLLIDNLSEGDYVGMIAYAGTAQVVLPSTSCERKDLIRAALERLQAGGSTNGGAGIEQAYAMAAQHFVPGGINRVILCSDGDFNVGITDRDALVHLIQQQASTGVFLSVFGFGMNNLRDDKLESLADRGNGQYAYLDTLEEAYRVLVERLGGTLETVAKDAKLQIEFNPQRASAYRLLGYENRRLRPEEFNDDTRDAGEIGAGHSVVALYEWAPTQQGQSFPGVDSLKYQPKPLPVPASSDFSDELCTVKLRYKLPDSDRSLRRDQVVSDMTISALESTELQFTAAVAAFGMRLRDREFSAQMSVEDIVRLATTSLGARPAVERIEFIDLLRRYGQLSP